MLQSWILFDVKLWTLLLNVICLYSRKEVLNHCVKWGHKFVFDCKMTGSASTGILDPCVCRASVRRVGVSYVLLNMSVISILSFVSNEAQYRYTAICMNIQIKLLTSGHWTKGPTCLNLMVKCLLNGVQRNS